jgi:hypothetical protein
MLPPKRSNKKPSPTKKYNTSKSKTGDSLAEDVFEIFDPTGISSYDDVYRSYKEKGLFSLDTGLEILGALPIIGKAGKGIKAIRTANKYIKGLNKVNKVVAKAEKVVPTVLKQGKNVGKAIQRVSKGGKANPIAATSIGVGMGAEGLQKLTKVVEKGTSKAVEKVIAKAPSKQDAINTTTATLNTINTLSDTAGAVQGQSPKKEESSKAQKPKTVYYNTNPKHGKVEKPGDEEGVRYVPISNSIQLEKWKAQNRVPVTSDLKTKVTREILGTLMPDQAAQFLSAIVTKDNKVGLQDLTPDIQEALINSVKNAKKRTGKNSGGTQYIDYSPEVEQAFQGMTAGKKQMVSTDPNIQAATILGRVSYKKNALGETEIYDSYDFSKTDPEKATTLYKKIRHLAGKVLPDEGKKPNLIAKIPAEELAYGTNSQGIMKNKMNPRKKYANGTNAKGMDPANYIISPAEAMNDYSIMLAKAEAEAVSNPWLPAVAIGGELLQTGIGLADNYNQKRFSSPTAANGMNNVQGDVEVEGGEMYETPQGQVGEFKGPSHEQGGIPLEVGQDVEEGTKVYSDRLKVGKKTLAERKETRERQIANLEKIASNGLADQAVKNAAKRKMQAIEKEEANDLAFQEQVNNIQAMADTMVMAFGTGMKGIQNYAMGTSADGIYVDGTDKNGIENPKLDVFGNPIIDLQSMTISPGVIDKDIQMERPAANVFKNLGWKKKLLKNNEPYIQEPAYTNRTDFGTSDFLDSFDPKIAEAKEDAAFYTPGQVGTPIVSKEDKPGTVFSRTAGKVGEAVGKVGVPNVGDMTKLIGNYLGMTSGIKTATEQRSTDVTHTNVFANAGKESQKLLDNAKQGIETSKAQAIVKANTVSRGGKRGARGSARGVNQMRAMDWLYDTALQSQIAEISANAAQQISGIDTQKSSVAMNADQLKGQGEFQANMANEAAKDAYYTALALGRKDFATGLQQTGKDFNDMKQNKVINNLLSQYGQWFKTNADGTVSNKNEVASESTNTTKEKEIELTDAKGKKFKITQSQFDKLMNLTE